MSISIELDIRGPLTRDEGFYNDRQVEHLMPVGIADPNGALVMTDAENDGLAHVLMDALGQRVLAAQAEEEAADRADHS